jgi:hypothetical protein
VKSNSDDLKKPYSTPILRLYGDIKDLTKAITNMGANGDALPSGSMIKTT